MRYFTFGFFEYKHSEVIKTGNGLFYSGQDKNIDKMKLIARKALKDSEAVITIQGIKELSKEAYDLVNGQD